MPKPTIKVVPFLLSSSLILTACGGGSSGSNESGNKMADTTAPVISLLGNNPINLTVGSNYTDSGATALDNIDGDISANIITNASSVNSAVVGSYAVTYNVSDNAGNAATQNTRTVNVIAQNSTDTPPTVSVSTPINGATVSSTISLSATASDDSAVAGVQFQLDGSNFGAEDTVAPYSLSWDTTTVTNGSHSLTAIARDLINQTRSATVNVTVNNSPAANPACSDGVDNDSDSLTDFPDDPGCTSLTDTDEFNTPSTGNVVINSASGNIEDGQTLTISGSGFTAKTNPKPLFWWKADFGETPSVLGRNTVWGNTSGLGNFSSAVVAPRLTGVC